jgi:hypothetical protein
MKKILIATLLLTLPFVGICDIVKSSVGARGSFNAEELPPIVEVDYLQSTGTQYIVLPFGLTSNDVFSISFSRFLWNSNYGAMLYACDRYRCIGASGNASLGTFQFDLTFNAKTYQQYGASTMSQQRTLTIDIPHQNYKISGNNVVQVVMGELTGKSMSLLANGAQCRLHEVKIERNGDVVFHLVPVRTGDIGFMLDVISGNAFKNSGTGSFIIGPDVAN